MRDGRIMPASVSGREPTRKTGKSRCIIPYPWYYPDDAVSARHFTDFAESLFQAGWDVSVLAGNRYHARKDVISPRHEVRNGVKITRFWCPAFSNSKNIGRLLNSFYLSIRWWFRLLLIKTDVIVFGTNPPFIHFMAPFLHFFRPKLPLVLWGFDLYPDAIIADGIKIPEILKKILSGWNKTSYRCFSLLVDIGSCMRRRFLQYHRDAQCETIVPWAFKEPLEIEQPDSTMRRELFGNAKLGLLYSGTIGKAHQFEEFILLARELRRRSASVAFCFAGRGNCYQKLQNMISPEDTNIRFAGFIEEDRLSLRLAAADIHLISLREGWDGVSVPSKFFGSLAAGRPLLYCGTLHSCIADMIIKEQFGFIVEMSTIQTIADKLVEFSNNLSCLANMQKTAFEYYNNHFSRKIQCAKWDKILREYIKVPKT